MAVQVQPQPFRKGLVGAPGALDEATNIDRRTCHRERPMEVLCFGLSRTGTSSLRQALFDLGYDDVYHIRAILNENPRDAEMWCEALEAKCLGKGKPFEREDWTLHGTWRQADELALLTVPKATTDTPSIFFWRELLDAYPEAKIILTVRDSPEAWVRSQQATVLPFTDELWPIHPTLFQRIRKMVLTQTAVDRMFEILVRFHPMFVHGLADLHNGTNTSKQFYDDWNAEIIQTIPKNRLLVLNLKEGWEPLCKFLGKEVPDHGFPKLNDGDTWRRNNLEFPGKLKTAALMKIAKYVSGAGVFIVGACALYLRRGW